MGKYSFDFCIDKTGICKVSVSKLGIVFSREAIESLGCPRKVHIGIDKTKKILGVCVAEENSSIKAFDFATTDARKKWLRIQSKALVDEISKIAKFQPTGSGQDFLAKTEDVDGQKFLIVDLTKK